MDAAKACRALEILRWGGIILGFQLAFFLGEGPQEQFGILMPWVVVSLAGLTGSESVFFGPAAAGITGYGDRGGGYQRQSGLNNLAVAVAALVVTALGWGTRAEAAVLCVLLVFVFLSGLNHSWSWLREGNRNRRNLLRPLGSLLLVAAALPCLLRAVAE